MVNYVDLNYILSLILNSLNLSFWLHRIVKMRIGLHTGTVLAGVVGRKMPR